MKMNRWISILLILFITAAIPFAGAAEESAPIPAVAPPRLYTAAYAGGNVSGLNAYQTALLRETITQGVRNYASEINLSAFDLPANMDALNQIYEMIYYEIPEAYHLSTFQFNSEWGKLNTIFPIYAIEKEQYDVRMAEIDAVADEMTADLNGLGEVEKALLLHDRLAIHCEYAYEELLNGTVYDHTDFFTFYGPLVEKRGVCHGYTLAYMYLLRKVGIESRMVISEALNHSWNIVTVNGKEYHVDVTHDDPVWDVTGYVRHINFLRSSDGIYSTSHKATDYDTSPSDTTYDNAFWQKYDTAFQYVGGRIYYLEDGDFTIRRYDDHSILLQEEGYWYVDEGSFYHCQSKLDSDGTYLLYSKAKCIMRVNPLNGKTEVVLRPEIEEPYHNIYGFTLDGDTLVMEICDTAYYNGETKKQYQQRFAYEELIGTEDVILLLQYLTGVQQAVNMELMDRNGDSRLTIADAVMMVRSLAA